MRYFFRVEYDGTAYGGWQTQTNAPSVQQAISNAFSRILRTPCECVGAGRTDAGVHARAQGAHIDIAQEIDIGKCERSVNALLPPAICIYRMQPVADAFHARHSAQKRSYRYLMTDRKRPLLYKRVWMVYYVMDWDLVRSQIPALLGSHDFSTFCASRTTTTNMTCNVSEASLVKNDDNYIFSIAADRFIYTMVRSIVGTLVDIGRGRFTDSLESIMKKKDRSSCGELAPPCGLFLHNVEYDGIF
jgi:tRNA pseudouridine38-40 synthase